jgi:acetyl-CoA C-acetyltransferase
VAEVRDAVICEPLRTAVGRLGGAFVDVPVERLAATVIKELVARTGIDGERVEDVILGQCHPNGEAPALGRVAALDAGLGVEVPGVQVDRRCGSGLQAVAMAAMQVQAGAADLLIAGGAESMSNVEHYSTELRRGVRGPGAMLHDRLARARETAGGTHFPVPGGMVETAENVRAEHGVSRADQDELALRSHRRAVAAQEAGRFDAEIVPVEVTDRKGKVTVIDRDEHPRADTSLEKLAKLRPMREKLDPESTVTAGNSSGQNDAAAVCLVTTPRLADELGLRPLARMVGWTVAGVPPRSMGVGPIPAIARLMERTGLSLADMDLIELNEAFASQVLACTRAWGLDEATDERLNVNGGGISLGHPLGATGARILATALRELDRRQGRYALETMCIGGGQGMAAVFERIG